MLAIGGCTVQELKARMARQEFAGWVEFYRLFPFDDRHRFHRPAALIAHNDRLDIDAAMRWLQPLPMAHDYTAADLNTLKAFGFSPPKPIAKG